MRLESGMKSMIKYVLVNAKAPLEPLTRNSKSDPTSSEHIVSQREGWNMLNLWQKWASETLQACKAQKCIEHKQRIHDRWQTGMHLAKPVTLLWKQHLTLKKYTQCHSVTSDNPMPGTLYENVNRSDIMSLKNTEGIRDAMEGTQCNKPTTNGHTRGGPPQSLWWNPNPMAEPMVPVTLKYETSAKQSMVIL